MAKDVFWCGSIGADDDLGNQIDGEFIDGRTKFGGSWAIMSPQSWAAHGDTRGRLGPGLGQRYKKQPDGRWLKVEG